MHEAPAAAARTAAGTGSPCTPSCLPPAAPRRRLPVPPPSRLLPPPLAQLNHFNLFGSGYQADCERLLARLGKKVK